MEPLKFRINETQCGMRLDKILSETLADQTRSFLIRLFDGDAVTVNGKAVKKSYKAALDDEVVVILPEPVPSDITPENIPLEIVYEDDDLLVVNKPKGMVVHPAPGHYNGTLVNALLYHCGDRLSTINGIIRPGILHRIDKDTSGLLLVAKNDMSHHFLAHQIMEHTLDRYYIAVVLGRTDPMGSIDAPIGRNPRDRQKMTICSNGKEAVTHYESMETFNGYSLIRCKLETGRTHQIRVHMASIGHPVLNDPLYNKQKCRVKCDFEGQCLHAQTIGFEHPSTGERMLFTAETPDYFTGILTKLRGS